MFHTQVELTSPNGKDTEIRWLPVPEGKAEVGEKVSRFINDDQHAVKEEWTITRVFTTLPEESIPSLARIATGFHRTAQTVYHMSI